MTVDSNVLLVSGLLAALVVLGLLAMVSETLRVRSIRPSTQSLREFLRDGPKVQVIRQVNLQGKTYFEVDGTMVEYPLTLPSGGAVYIFDDRGVLADWTADGGEPGAQFAQKWYSIPQSDQKVLTATQALELVRTP